ncbi:MAG: L,D-transpeptidase [Myxococcales bacterium]|nr:L,D-transpeptidase [Myxococcales bacterium]
MWDDFFVAIDREEKVADVWVYRTIYGEYVRADHVKLLDVPPLRGEALSSDLPLPLAFVHGADDVTLWCERGPTLEACGAADRYARFSPRGIVARGEQRYVRGPRGALIASEHVRIARASPPPLGVSEADPWVHIDLLQQTLVAYEGTTAVFATLVSSGKPGHDTPTGLYRVQRKYLSKIMRGHDPKEGIYHVEEVPWTTYYHGAYAVHGAYWHNTFGAVRSHGCTNLAPADARWLYYWGAPMLEPHFHAEVNENGLALYFTRDE